MGNIDSHVVYAHVINGSIKYIGECSVTFRSRMRLYITHSGSTNVYVRKAILQALGKGLSVETYYYKPQMITLTTGLTINPYVGIEQALIKKLRLKLINKKDVGA